MQIFPDISSSGVSALGGVSLIRDTDLSYGSANSFLSSLNEELAAAGYNPVVDSDSSQAAPRGFRQVNQDVSATLDTEDVDNVVKKLRERGVDETALAGIEGLLASGSTLTIGNIMGAIRGNGRLTGELTDEELNDIGSALQKMGFSTDEADEITQMMLSGQGFDAMRKISARAKELGENALGLSKAEANALMRGMDLSDTAMKKFAALSGDDDAEINGAKLEQLLGPAREELAWRKTEQEKAAAEFKGVIEEALREKKMDKRNELVGDTRGSQLTDRAEKRMRDDLTAKGNGLGPKSREELEEEAALADEEASWNRREHSRRNETAERAGDMLDSSRKKMRGDTEKTPSAKEEFSTAMRNRVDVAPGTAAPVQNQPVVPQQTQATSFAHRQEIFSQVEQGMLRQLADGSRQMTMQLNPGELGQVTLILSVKAGEVRALIRTETPEATAALSDQMAQLKATLEEQGLKVAQLDVETQLPQDTTKEQWSNTAQFNKEQEMREQARLLQLAKLRRESGTNLAQDMQSKTIREEISASGLHIIA